MENLQLELPVIKFNEETIEYRLTGSSIGMTINGLNKDVCLKITNEIVSEWNNMLNEFDSEVYLIFKRLT